MDFFTEDKISMLILFFWGKKALSKIIQVLLMYQEETVATIISER